MLFCLGWNYFIDRGLTFVDSMESGQSFSVRRGIIRQIVLNNTKKTTSFSGYCGRVYFQKHVIFEPRWHWQRDWQEYKDELIKFLGANRKNVLKIV